MNASTRKQTPADTQPASYEQATAELEQLVQQLESGQMSLDDTLKSYQRGATLLRYCREKLQAVEQQIQILDGTELKPYASDRQAGN
ncbi:exodeoxyribonuclease 7 small subunit [mine drainage metagenome]|jgi:exodeoxyribonuclease VII small subunit|uniref:Exodeoxyribonuclease 7 small subunit n=2 Tax=root TaxID=1 RepID=A0A238D9G0_THIDL|nr:MULTISPECIES: exodeoxyribonuclease VII small subunit [Thiomonas]MDE2128939.1 exodeoxyribonuclease VII small subunit [Betaproteobacteria bacterium]OZB46325.1 MAG: exodeoxyribonuclease VII small subunit [Thiomonas sp. 15-66-11]OZB64662.1 MAG: exodeoxyribonuclease VII small subunit [Thiomonas sp. 13-66-29]SBP89947.1 exonuclease VII small subunit [Thiomonas delicata]